MIRNKLQKILLNYKTIKNNKDYTRVLTNFFSLSIIQVLNYLVPLITLPYLVRTLGIENYGLITFGQIVISYFDSLMQYGFNLTVVNTISQNSDNKVALSRIVSTILGSKLVLFFISLLLLFALIFSIPRFFEIKNLLFLSILYLVGNMLNFDWFFQGIQEMRNITLLNVIGRIFSLVWIFTMVQSEADIYTAFLSIPLTNVLTGSIAMFFLVFKYKVRLSLPSFQTILSELRLGFHIFLSQIMVRFYSADINITILGFLTNNTIIGVYSLSNRVFALLVSIGGPIVSAVYPYLAQLYTKDYITYKAQLKKIISYTFIFFSLLSISTLILSDWIINFISGHDSLLASSILRILCFALVFAPFGSIINQVFILHNQNIWLSVISFAAVFINIATLIINYYFFLVKGLAITSVVTHLFLIIFPLFLLKKLRIDII